MRTLNDYFLECHLDDVSTAGTVTLNGSYNNLRYTKVGRLVSFQLRLQLSNKGSGTNNIRIGGLPFTPSTSGLDYDYFIITLLYYCITILSYYFILILSYD